MNTVIAPELVDEFFADNAGEADTGFETPEQEASYNAWLAKKIAASLADPRPAIPHEVVIANAWAYLESKQKNRAAS